MSFEPDDNYRAAYEGGIGADRMAAGLSCIPDPLRGDLDEVIKLRAKPAPGASSKPVAASERDMTDEELWELRKRGELVEPVPCRNTPEKEQAYRNQRIKLLTAVAMAAEALHAANQLEMSAAAMNDRWRALEDALNEWRAGK